MPMRLPPQPSDDNAVLWDVLGAGTLSNLARTSSAAPQASRRQIHGA